MSVQARLKVMSVVPVEGYSGHHVSLQAVYSSDPASPNYSFSQATPTASLTMYITNPTAFEQFKEGTEYDLVFTPVETKEIADA